MTQTFIDDKGVRHSFPDDATPEEIDAATGGGGTGGNTDAQDQRSFGGKMLDTLGKVGSTTVDEARAMNRGITLGGWDNLVGMLPGTSPEEQRQKTMDAKGRLAFGGAIPEMAGTALSTAIPEAKLPGLLGGAAVKSAGPSILDTGGRMLSRPLIRSAGTGAVMSGIQAENDRRTPEQVGLDMAGGGVFGAALHGATSGLNKLGGWLTGTGDVKPPNTASADMRRESEDELDRMMQFAYPRQSLDKINTASQNDVKNNVTNVTSGAPLTDTSVDQASAALYDKFGKRFEIVRPGKNTPGSPGTPVWPGEVEKWKNDADKLNNRYGNILSGRLEDLMQNGPTIKLAQLGEKPPMMTPELQNQYNDEAYSGILNARNYNHRQTGIDALDAAQEAGNKAPIKKALRDNPDLDPGVASVLREANRGTPGSNWADRADKVLPAAAAAGTTAAAGLAGFKSGLHPALNTLLSGLGIVPAVKATTYPIAEAMKDRMYQQMRDRITGAVRPAPDTSVEDRFKRMLLGGWTSQQ